MDDLTKQLIAIAGKIRGALDRLNSALQQREAIDQTQRGHQQEYLPPGIKYNQTDRLQGHQVFAAYLTVLMGYLTVVVTFFAFSAAAVYAYVAYKQWQTTVYEVDVSNRPWVRVSNPVVTDPVTITSDGTVTMPIQLTAENIGRTPAFDAGFETLPILTQADPNGVLTAMCSHKKPTKVEKLTGPLGEAVFPGAQLSAHSFTPTGKMAEDRSGEYVLPFKLVGCLQYKSSISTDTDYTGFSYDVYLHAGVVPEPLFRIRFNTDGTATLNDRVTIPVAAQQLRITPENVKLILTHVGVIAK